MDLAGWGSWGAGGAGVLGLVLGWRIQGGPPARPLEWHSTPPPQNNSRSTSLPAVRIPTSLARHCPRGQAVCKLQRLDCSILHPYHLDGVKQTIEVDSLFLFQPRHVLRWSSDARRTEHAPNGARRINGATGCPDRRRRRLHGPRDPDFQDSSRSHFFFFSSHHLDLFSFLLALRNWLLDPIQPASTRPLIGSSCPEPEPGLFEPHAEREGIQGDSRWARAQGERRFGPGELGFGDFSSFPSLSFSSFPLCLLLKHVLIPSSPGFGATMARAEVPNTWKKRARARPSPVRCRMFCIYFSFPTNPIPPVASEPPFLSYLADLGKRIDGPGLRRQTNLTRGGTFLILSW